MKKILVIEDDQELAYLFSSVLKKESYDVKMARDGIEAFDLLENQDFDLIISDIMMPRMDGFEFVEAFRQEGYDTPIIFITAKSSFEDKKTGFRLGIDDYMVKPIDINELVLRVEAVIRRYTIREEALLKVGETELDFNTLTVARGDKEIELPMKEFQILHKLLSSPNHIYSRQQLMDEFWGMASDSTERTIDVHIKRLRDRFEDNPDFHIKTVRGLGYKCEVNTNE